MSPALRLATAATAAAGLGLLVACLPAAEPVPARAELVGSYAWHEAWRGFGGYSAIELGPDGRDAVILSDRTAFVEGRLARNAEGAVTGFEAEVRMLGDAEGRGLRSPDADSEGLAVTADGTTFISFEGRTRVRREGADGGPPVELPSHPDFARMGENRGLEALAVDADGTLYAIPERPPRRSSDYPVYRFQGEAWDVAFRISRGDGFAVAGADVGPDGRLYVLERAFNGLGFRTRVRRFALDGTGEATLIVTPTGRHDNLEGIAVWDDGQSLRLTMIADDNFRFLQRTEIVDYRLLD